MSHRNRPSGRFVRHPNFGSLAGLHRAVPRDHELAELMAYAAHLRREIAKRREAGAKRRRLKP